MKTADTTKVAALMANAGPGPAKATSAPAAGARAIWEITALDQIAELAATMSSGSTSDGSTLAAAGLNSTVSVDRANALA